MVTKLYHFRSFKAFAKWVRSLGYSESTARKAWAGPGWYYHRGKGYIVKYSQARDKARGGKVGRGPWRHTHDLVKVVVKLRKHAKATARRVVKRKALVLKKKRVKAPVTRAAKHTLAYVAVKTKKVPSRVKQIAAYLWDQIPKKYKEGKGKVWTYVAVLALAKYIHRKLGDRDWKAIDWSQEIDWAQGYRYAKAEVDRLLGTGRKYEGLSEREIEMIEKHWESVRRELKLPDTIDPWELKALFE